MHRVSPRNPVETSVLTLCNPLYMNPTRESGIWVHALWDSVPTLRDSVK